MNQPAFIPSASEPGRVRFTTTDYRRMRDAGAFTDLRVELVRGELAKMMPSYLAHGEVNLSLAARLMNVYAGAARVGVDVLIETGPDSLRAPDIVVAAADAPAGRPLSPSQTLLLVEIADTTLAKDLGGKLAEYAAAGVTQYWVVDLAADVVHVMTDPDATGYRSRSVIRFGEPLTVPETGGRTITVD